MCSDSKDQIKIMSEQMTLKGTLKGHNGWVTQIATTPVFPDMLLSASRDKTIIMWHLTREDTQYGIPKRRLQGHSHFVSDVVISSDGQFALSGSWDGTLRLWDLASGNTVSNRDTVWDIFRCESIRGVSSIKKLDPLEFTRTLKKDIIKFQLMQQI